MNVNKLATEIMQYCRDYKNCDGRIKVSKVSKRQYDVYHAFGSTVQGYEGDNAQQAFNRVIFSIDLNEIDWKKPLRKYIVEQLRQYKREVRA